MKQLKTLLTALAAIMLSFSCDVHEFPDMPQTMPVHLVLEYDTDMTEWHHIYDNYSVIEQGLGETTECVRDYGHIRYIIRAYPVSDKHRSLHTQEFVFTRSIGDCYDDGFTVDLIPGEYNIMVWSDLLEQSADPHFHNADNFAEISLHGEHQGNNDHRDAFRGSNGISVMADIIERAPDTLAIAMHRPLAKYEFITSDLREFVGKELELLKKEAITKGEEPPTKVELDSYKVVFYYSGFMPDTYNMHSDKPVDSRMGVLFESRLDVLGEQEASMGFDYVFVNGKDAGVTVQIALYNKDDKQISLTEPIDVPLRRSHHTILRGSFLSMEASGGITINPDFDGEHNIII